MRPAVTLALLVLVVLLCCAPSALAVVPQGNIVVNPGAEAGPGATDVTSSPAIPGWTVTAGRMTAVRYGAVDFPDAADGSSVAGDNNFFAGGPSSPTSTAEQTIDVSAATPEIDAGNLSWNLSAFIGGFSGQNDQSTLTINLKDAIGNTLAFRTLGPVTQADRSNQTALLFRSAFGTLPVGTRSIQIVITATRGSGGTYNDGYVDNVNMSLGTPASQPVIAKSIDALPVSGDVLVEVPGSKSFVPLTNVSTLPVGSIIDTRKGRVRLQAADGHGGFSFADFYEGVFKLTQDRKGIVTLSLFGGSFKSCGKGGIAAGKKTKSIRHLWGQGSGKFRTEGRFASATIRGTTWLTDDQCGGTLVRVTVGTVTVRDLPKKKNVVVKAPKRYFARAKR